MAGSRDIHPYVGFRAGMGQFGRRGGVYQQHFMGKVILLLNPENCSIHGAGWAGEREEGSGNKGRELEQQSSAGKQEMS